MFRVRSAKFISAAALLVLIAAAGYLWMLVSERQLLLAQAARYNVTWSITQAVNELSRFEQQVAETALPQRDPGLETRKLRFDIMLNRLALLNDGEVAAFTARDPDRRTVVAELTGAAAEIQGSIERLDEPATAERVLARLSPLDAPLARLAAASNREAGERVARTEQELGPLSRALAAVCLAILAESALLLLIVFRQESRLRQGLANIQLTTGVRAAGRR